MSEEDYYNATDDDLPRIFWPETEEDFWNRMLNLKQENENVTDYSKSGSGSRTSGIPSR